MKKPTGSPVSFATVWTELHDAHTTIPDSYGYASGHVAGLQGYSWYEEEVNSDELSRRIVDPDPTHSGHIHPSPDGFHLALPGETMKEIADQFEARCNEYDGDPICPDRIRQLAKDWKRGIDLGPMFFEVVDGVESEPVIIDGLHRSVAILLSGRPGSLRAFYAYPTAL